MAKNTDIKEYFKVPEGYFEELHDSIMAQIDHLPATESTAEAENGRVRMLPLVLKRVAVAAAVTAVLVLSATLIWENGDTAIAENTAMDTAAILPETVVAEVPEVKERDVVSVKDNAIAAVPKHNKSVAVEHKPVKSVTPAKAKGKAASTELTADELEEALMIDGQMLHQMIVSEM